MGDLYQMPGILDLANNLASATKDLAVAFGLANPEPKFPESVDYAIVSDFQKAHWYKTPSQGLYAFSVDEVGKASVSEFPAFVENIKSLFTGFFDDGAFTFTEFNLPITPQEIQQTEDFAVSIKPTQGGSVINHSGNKFKTLIISGTTGVQPYRGMQGVNMATGNAFGQPNELKYRSGYEVFQHFRAWMRAYHQMKTKPGSEKYRMLFRNYKDWEFLYVEPIKFTMKRSAAKPLLYDYNVVFKVLGVHKINKPLFEMIIAKFNEISFALVNSYKVLLTNNSVSNYIAGEISDFMANLNQLKLCLKSTDGATNWKVKQSGLNTTISGTFLGKNSTNDWSMLDISKKNAKQNLSDKQAANLLIETKKQAESQDASDITKAGNAGLSVKYNTSTEGFNLAEPGSIDLSSIPSDISKSTPTELTKMKSQLIDMYDSLAPLLESIPLTNSITNPALLNTLESEVSKSLQITQKDVAALKDQCQDIIDKLNDSLGLGDPLYNTIMGKTSTVDPDNPPTGLVTDEQYAYLKALQDIKLALSGILSTDELFDKIKAANDVSSSTNGAGTIGQGIFALPNKNTATKVGKVPAGMSLEDIALMELGDSSLWTVIAELNNLKPPYIVQEIDGLKVSHEVQSINYYDPTTIQDISIGYKFLIPSMPAPVGLWSGKSDYIAEYQDVGNWRFIYPDDKTVVKVIPTQEYYQFSLSTWGEVFADDYQTDGILKPGDNFLLPTTNNSPIVTPLQGPKDNPYTNTLTNAEKSMSVDLALTTDGDLDLTPSGDLNVSYGIDNGAQAIVMKLLFEKGGFKKYPDMGTHLVSGKKVPDVSTIRGDVLASLLQDTRIKNVTKINIIQDNGGYLLSFDVIFNDLQQPVPISLPI